MRLSGQPNLNITSTNRGKLNNNFSWHRFGHAESRRKCETTNKTTGMAAFVNFGEAKLRYALSMAYQAHGFVWSFAVACATL